MQTFRSLDRHFDLIPATISRQLSEIDVAHGRQEAFALQYPAALDALKQSALVQSVEASNAIENITARGQKAFRLIGPDGRELLSTEPGKLGGHRRTRIYGRLDCPSALRAIARGGYVRDRVFFADEETAVAAGYRPCFRCLPERYRAWKVAAAPSPEPPRR